MLVVRGTKKLRDRIRAAPTAGPLDTSTTLLGDWFGTALFWKPQVAMFVNSRTFIPVFMPLAPAGSVLDRLPEAVAAVLRCHGAPDSFLASELDAMREVRLAPTNDRSMLGVMNEYAYHGKWRHEASTDLVELSINLAGMSIGPLRDRTGFPDLELAAVLGIASPRRGAAPTPPPRPPRADVYQLKVTLLGTKPPIWRRVLVDASSTLDQLHEVIQAAFGWWNYHLHEFEVGRTRYGVPDPEWDDFGVKMRDERRTRVDQIAKLGGKFRYTYDFGDGWEHDVVVEKVLEADSVVTTPACVDGRRAGPPEDCGGPWGYRELVAILADPTHPDHAERVEWISAQFEGEFDPDAFDPSDFEDNLQSIRLARFDD
jgi:hypothetical protein